jgi:hypothetical protein
MVFGRAKRLARRFVAHRVCHAPQRSPTAIQSRYRPAAGREPLVGVMAIEIATSLENLERQREGSTRTYQKERDDQACGVGPHRRGRR